MSEPAHYATGRPGSFFSLTGFAYPPNATATVLVIGLDPNAPLHPKEGSGTMFGVPGGIAFTESVYLPLLPRQQ